MRGIAARRNARVLPVDSEHSAIFQALQAGRSAEVARVVLTASGGPFRGRHRAELVDVSAEEALHFVPLQARGAVEEFGRIIHVSRAARVDVNAEARIFADERPGGPSVIHVDMS